VRTSSIIGNNAALAIGPTTNHAMTFRTNNTTRMTLGTDGNLRWGTGTAETQIHVFDTDAQITVESTDTGNKTVRLGSGTSAGDGFVGSQSNHGFSIVTNNTRRIDVSNAGTVTLTAYGAGTLSTNGSGVISASDGALKTKLTTPVPGLDAVNALAPVYYRWNDDSPFASDVEELGFIAQEVGSVIPAASPELKDGQLYRNYHDRAIIAVLVKAVQELSQRVTELEAAL
jgi:hypothetical protein